MVDIRLMEQISSLWLVIMVSANQPFFVTRIIFAFINEDKAYFENVLTCFL